MAIYHVDLTTSSPRRPPDQSLNNLNAVDREEGEIVEDEFEDISSDEEFTMRKRIQELEARNAELEKIANISGLYGNYGLDIYDVEIGQSSSKKFNQSGNDYCTRQPPSTSFSSKKQRSNYTSFQKSTTNSTSLPKKYTYRGHYHENRTESSNCNRSQHNSSHRGRDQSSSPDIIFTSQNPLLKSNTEKRKTRIGSGGSSLRNQRSKLLKRSPIQKKTNCGYEIMSSSDEEEYSAVNRDKLRLAIKRNPDNCTSSNKNAVTLDKKLLAISENFKANVNDKKDEMPIKTLCTNETLVIDDNTSDDSFSLEEQELRLIALKSAVVKKHLARKKRREIDANDAKKPYSPSDFDNIKITPSPNNSEINGTYNSMDVSPIESPELVLSENEDDTKPIDMDLVNSSDSDAPIFVGQERWLPIQEIPLPNTYTDVQSTIEASYYHSPQPRKLKNLEEKQFFINSLQNYNSEENINVSDSVQFSENMDIVDEKDGDSMELDDKSYSNDNSQIVILQNNSPETTDGEELALRALLLSKMNSPKIKLSNSATRLSNTGNHINQETQTLDTSTNIIHSNKSDEEIENNDENLNLENEVDVLRNLILSSMKSNKTAFVLKEAVRRLKNSTVESPQLHNNCISNSNIIENESNIICENNLSIASHCMDLQNNITKQHISPLNVSNQYFHENSHLLVNEEINYFQPEHLLLPPNYENIFQPISLPPHHFNSSNILPTNIHAAPIRHGLKLIPLALLKKCPDNLNKTTKVSHCNNNLINVPLKNLSSNNNNSMRTQSPNLKEITLVQNDQSKIIKLDTETEIIEKDDQHLKKTSDSDIIPINCDRRMDNQSNINNLQLKKYDENVGIKSLVSEESSVRTFIDDKPFTQNCKINESNFSSISQNTKLNQSLEITKKIASLTKLSNSIQQTTEISKKSKFPISKKLNNTNILKKSLNSKSAHTISKIINTHKIINHNSTHLKRKTNTKTQHYDSNVKVSKVINDNTVLSKLANKTKLITSIETPPVNKMVISLESSDTDTEESDFENIDLNKPCIDQLVRCATDDNDNVSPKSFQMESPCYSPKTIYLNSPRNCIVSNKQVFEEISNETAMITKTIVNNHKQISDDKVSEKMIINDVFEAKLDEFLKNARTQVENNKAITDSVETITTCDVPITPVAVRHLPESSQLEYRRLVSRMQILEKQKLLKKYDNEKEPELTNFKVTIRNDNLLVMKPTQTHVKSVLSGIKKTFTNESVVEKLSATTKDISTNSVSKKTEDDNSAIYENIVRELKPSDRCENLDAAKLSESKLTNKKKTTELLHRYEEAYKKNGSNIIDNIGKALDLVAQGKAEKLGKLALQKRIEKLRQEMSECESQLCIRNEKISKIYPAIITAHKTVGNLKIKRTKLNKAATALGKSINGENYRLSEENNLKITENFQNLSDEIKILKNLKISDWGIGTINNSEEKIKLQLNESNNCDIHQNIEPRTAATTETIEVRNDHCNAELISHSKNESKDDGIVIEKIGCEVESISKHVKLIDHNLKMTDVPKKMVPYVSNDELPLYEKHYSNLQCSQKNIKFNHGLSSLKYTSPLDYRTQNRYITMNPFGIICPYQLMGQCDDKNCNYEHSLQTCANADILGLKVLGTDVQSETADDLSLKILPINSYN